MDFEWWEIDKGWSSGVDRGVSSICNVNLEKVAERLVYLPISTDMVVFLLLLTYPKRIIEFPIYQTIYFLHMRFKQWFWGFNMMFKICFPFKIGSAETGVGGEESSIRTGASSMGADE